MLLAGLRRVRIQGCGVERVGYQRNNPLGSAEGIENHNWEMGNPDRVEVLVPHGIKEVMVLCKKGHTIMED